MIRGLGGHYVFTVKANNKHLYAQLKNPPWKHVPGRVMRESGHGRRETRAIKTAEVPAWIEFEGAARVAQLRRTTWRKKSRGSPERKSVEAAYLITSADRRTAGPLMLADGFAGAGASRTNATTSVMSPTTRTAPRSVPVRHPKSWPPRATPRSGCSERPDSTMPPRPTVTRSVTRPALSDSCRPDFAEALVVSDTTSRHPKLSPTTWKGSLTFRRRYL